MHSTVRPLAILAGVMFAATATMDIPHDKPETFTSTIDYALEGCFAVALLAAAVAFLFLLRSAGGIGVRTGWGLAGLGHALMGTSSAATFVRGQDSLEVIFPAGLLAIALGYVVLLVLDLRRRVVPRFAGIVLFVATIAMVVAGEGYGLVAWSAGWFAFAAVLAPARSRETAAAQVSRPVR